VTSTDDDDDDTDAVVYRHIDLVQQQKPRKVGMQGTT